MQIVIYTLILFGGVALIFFIIPLLIAKLINDIRSKRLGGIARIMGLNFKKNSQRKFFDYFQSTSSVREKKNIIEGKINGHNIYFYDYQGISNQVLYWLRSTTKQTVISIDGKTEKINTFASVNLIKKILADLRDKNKIFKMADLSFFQKVIIRKKLFILLILLFVICFLIYGET